MKKYGRIVELLKTSRQCDISGLLLQGRAVALNGPDPGRSQPQTWNARATGRGFRPVFRQSPAQMKWVRGKIWHHRMARHGMFWMSLIFQMLGVADLVVCGRPHQHPASQQLQTTPRQAETAALPDCMIAYRLGGLAADALSRVKSVPHPADAASCLAPARGGECRNIDLSI